MSGGGGGGGGPSITRYEYAWTTTCPARLLENINDDVGIGPTLLQIITEYTDVKSVFEFDAALTAGEQTILSDKLGAWSCPTAGTGVAPDDHEIDDSNTGALILWTSNKVNTELSGKSDTGHTHVEADITDLQAYLTSVDWSDIGGTLSNQTDLQTALDGKSATGHTHTKSAVTDFTEGDYLHTTGAESAAGNKTFSDDVIIQGDLTVNGTQTIINTEEHTVNDNIMTLNAASGDPLPTVPTENAGIEIDRYDSTNASLIWNESTDKWTAGLAGSETEISLVGHTHTESDITDLGSNVSIIAGVGLSGGGTIDASRTLDLDINGLTADGSPDGAVDYVATYDASAGTNKKVLLDDLPGANVIFGSEYQYEADEDTSSTSSTSWQNKVTMNTSSLPSGTYRIGWTWVGSADANNKSIGVRIIIDDTTTIAFLDDEFPTTKSFTITEGDKTALETNVEMVTGVTLEDTVTTTAQTGIMRQSSGFKHASLSGITKIQLDYRRNASTSATVRIEDARIELWRVS